MKIEDKENSNMHILISALSRFTQPTGLCRHSANLAIALSERAEVGRITVALGSWQSEYFGDCFNLRSSKIEIVPIRIPNNSLARNAWFAFGLPHLARELKPHLVQVSFPVPLFRTLFTVPVVTTIHDLYPYDYPEGCGRLSLFFKQRFVKRAIKNSDGLTTVSHATMHSLLKHFPNVSSDRVVEVAGNYANLDSVSPCRPGQVRDGSRFLLCVGQHQKNKRLDLLLKAFHLLRSEGRIDHRIELLIAGSPGSQTEKLMQLSRDLQVENAVHWLPSVPDAELAWLYGNCEVFVVSSCIEGFCLPLLEAISFSCRVVCSDILVLHEVGGENCAYFDLRHEPVRNLASAIVQALDQPPASSNVGSRYSKAATASDSLRLYASLLQTTCRTTNKTFARG